MTVFQKFLFFDDLDSFKGSGVLWNVLQLGFDLIRLEWDGGSRGGRSEAKCHFHQALGLSGCGVQDQSQSLWDLSSLTRDQTLVLNCNAGF